MGQRAHFNTHTHTQTGTHAASFSFITKTLYINAQSKSYLPPCVRVRTCVYLCVCVEGRALQQLKANIISKNWLMKLSCISGFISNVHNLFFKVPMLSKCESSFVGLHTQLPSNCVCALLPFISLTETQKHTLFITCACEQVFAGSRLSFHVPNLFR